MCILFNYRYILKKFKNNFKMCNKWKYVRAHVYYILVNNIA